MKYLGQQKILNLIKDNYSVLRLKAWMEIFKEPVVHWGNDLLFNILKKNNFFVYVKMKLLFLSQILKIFRVVVDLIELSKICGMKSMWCTCPTSIPIKTHSRTIVKTIKRRRQMLDRHSSFKRHNHINLPDTRTQLTRSRISIYKWVYI